MRIGSLFSGVGGLELGLEWAGLGEVAWQAEIDPAASEVLARHWPGVPNLGDVRGADLPPVDVVCGGVPCQPVSSAGRRKGTDDDRWLWDDAFEAVGRMDPRPGLLVFENVRGLLSANGGDAMARVVHGLARLGYVGRYGLLRAADVGAPHRRERVFVVAHATGDEGRVGHGDGRPARDADGARTDPRPTPGASRRGAGEPDSSGPAIPDSDGGRLQVCPQLDSEPELDASDRGACRRHADGCDHAPADTGGERCHGRQDLGRDGREAPERSEAGGDAGDGSVSWGQYRPAIERWERLTRPASHPRPDGRLSPAFVEWMMGYPEGWVDGLTRTAALRCLGNAVVPQVAELAARTLIYGTGGAGVQPERDLLPTPTASQPGGTAEAHLERKRRDGSNRQAVTDLGMVIEQVLS